MAIPYPSSPTVGQTFTYGGITYTWNGVAWIYTVTNNPAVVGSVAVTAPITNTGTSTAPVIGINQSALAIAATQVTGTAIVQGSTQLVPSGGTANQVLSKIDSTNYNTQWVTPSAGGSFTGGTLTSNLTLVAGSTAVSPLTFQSGTALNTAVAGAIEYDGIVFYETPNATTGRAVDLAGFYYTNTSLYTMDFASSATAKSLLGSSTAGLTVPAGQTYEYEMFLALQGVWGGVTASQQGTLAVSSSTVSGSPVVAYNHFIEIGSNNTGFTTATTPTITKTNTGRTLTAVTSVNSNQRYFIKLKGILRVTGTGSAKVFPSLAMDVTSADNAWTISANNLIFKATPIGNGTVTSIGIS